MAADLSPAQARPIAQPRYRILRSPGRPHDRICSKCPLGKYGEPSLLTREIRRYRNDIAVAEPRSVIGHFSKGTGKLNNGLIVGERGTGGLSPAIGR